jgi:putative zinc finger protein
MEGSPRTPSPVDASDEYAQWDAAYVLGSLSEAERGEYEAHLRRCPSCRRSVEDLSGMPAILGQLTLENVTEIDQNASLAPPPNPQVLTSLLTTVRRRRRNVRWATSAGFAAAAAAVVIAVLVGGQSHGGAPVSVTSQPPQAAANELTMTPAAPTELTATFAMVSQHWGTQITMNCIYASESRESSAPDADQRADTVAMVVVGRDGRRDRLASWKAVEGVRATPAGSTSMPIDQIASVQIVSADTGSVLLQRTV